MLRKMFANIVTLYDYKDPKVESFFKGDVSDEDMIDHLKQWDHGDTPVEYEEMPVGKDDTVEHDGYYYFYFNRYGGYCGLVEQVDEP